MSERQVTITKICQAHDVSVWVLTKAIDQGRFPEPVGRNSNGARIWPRSALEPGALEPTPDRVCRVGSFKPMPPYGVREFPRQWDALSACRADTSPSSWFAGVCS